ncbi:MAG TPA: hypothetical protein VFC57_07725 [Aeromicrobium sp.]|nr:hypothetical protein [Aeromicrobium sp.]
MKVANRLRILVFTLAGLMLFIAGTSYLTIQEESGNVSELALVLYPLVDVNGEIFSSMVDAEIGLRGNQSTVGPIPFRQYSSAISRVDAAQKEFDQLLARKKSDTIKREVYEELSRKQAATTNAWRTYAHQAEITIREGGKVDTAPGNLLFDGFRAVNNDIRLFAFEGVVLVGVSLPG